jgi:4-alpha-glucanotransferase
MLLHPTSLSTRYVIGDLGPAAYGFIDFLSASGLRWWQMLPIGPVGPEGSPYQSYSAFAGNAQLISPDLLLRAHWIRPEDAEEGYATPSALVDFKRAAIFKDQLLRKAFKRFQRLGTSHDYWELKTFQKTEAWWLKDYTFFCALRTYLKEEDWTRWPALLRLRQRKAMAQIRQTLVHETDFFAFQEWVFTRQWNALRAYAAQRGIGFIGDIPIFVAPGSCDVWAHPDIFQLRANGRPRVVAGVPPDYFSKTGQRWGNPHYRWETLKKQHYPWWMDRFKKNLAHFDIVRLDHFIGFIRFYEIPGDAPTAEKGRYKKGPGADFFRTVLRALSAEDCPPFIAEDLGVVTPDVKRLRDTFRLPGMKVLQFAFGADPEAKNYQPHAYPKNCVAYTGTHDNDTTVGWFKNSFSERSFTLRYLNCRRQDIHWAMIRAAFASAANTAIAPLQDFLGLGSKARMNRPGTAQGNWGWRMSPHVLTTTLAKKIRVLSETFGRI